MSKIRIGRNMAIAIGYVNRNPGVYKHDVAEQIGGRDPGRGAFASVRRAIDAGLIQERVSLHGRLLRLFPADHPTGITPTYIAYANGTRNDLGTDAGISVYRKEVEGGQVMDERQITSWTGTEIDGEDGELDTDAAGEQLGYFGWRLAGAGWIDSGDGQMSIEVEPWDDGRDVAGL